MNRLIAWLLATLPLLFACASNTAYRAASQPERAEMSRDMLDVYPGDIRRNLELYNSAGVGWAGLILHTEAETGPDGLIYAVTTFEHHYFNWKQDRRGGRLRLNLSPRGEGLFRTAWVLRGQGAAADGAAAERLAGPGQLAIVYGVPEKVEAGTVVSRYRFLRVVDAADFNTNRADYGRFGEPFRYIDNPAGKPKS